MAIQALQQARKTIAQLDQQSARQNFVNLRRGIVQQVGRWGLGAVSFWVRCGLILVLCCPLSPSPSMAGKLGCTSSSQFCVCGGVCVCDMYTRCAWLCVV